MRCSTVLHPLLATLLPVLAIGAQRVPDQDLPVSNHGARRILGSDDLPIDVDRDGSIGFAGREVDYATLSERLSAAEDPSRGIVIRAHRDLPLAALQKVFDACTNATPRRWKLRLGVGTRGNVLPHELPATADAKPDRRPHIVSIERGGEPAPITDLAASLVELARDPAQRTPSRRSPGKSVVGPVKITAEGDIPYAAAVTAIDRAFAAGFADIRITATPTARQSKAWAERQDLEALVSATQRRDNPLAYRLSIVIPNAAEKNPEVATSPGFKRPQSGQWNSAVGLGGGAGGAFGGRGGGRRMMARGKGKAISESIGLALQWLVARQEEDGHLSVDPPTDGRTAHVGTAPIGDLGASALALLAFLGDGSTMRSGPHKEPVRKIVIWMRERQDPATGAFKDCASHVEHALATAAMVEAYGLSSYKLLKKNSQLAIDHLLQHPLPEAAAEAAWFVQAARAARDFKLDVSEAAWKAMTPMDDTKGAAPEGATLFAEILRGDVDRDELSARAARIGGFTPTPEVSIDALGPLGWYYGSYALYQAGGPEWRRWSKTLTAVVPKAQRKEGAAKGSWLCKGQDPVVSTALLCLSMQAYYRFTMMVR